MVLCSLYPCKSHLRSREACSRKKPGLESVWPHRLVVKVDCGQASPSLCHSLPISKTWVITAPYLSIVHVKQLTFNNRSYLLSTRQMPSILTRSLITFPSRHGTVYFTGGEGEPAVTLSGSLALAFTCRPLPLGAQCSEVPIIRACKNESHTSQLRATTEQCPGLGPLQRRLVAVLGDSLSC